MRGANAVTMMGRRRLDEELRRRAMVRLNGMMFYCTGIASFVESTAPLDTRRLLRLSDGLADVRPWLERVWLPARAKRGEAFRAYIGDTWPEFEWDAAYDEFLAVYQLRTAVRVEPPGHHLEFVARCVTETSLAVFYRSVARSADEPRLRELAASASTEHSTYFSYFRRLLDRLNGHRRIALAASCRAAIVSCRAAREVDVAAAFSPLNRYWHGGWVFPELSYAGFLARLAQLLRRHGELGSLERLLFRPWFTAPKSAGESLPQPAVRDERRTRGQTSSNRAA